jgi:Ca-activated chloride channel family protein
LIFVFLVADPQMIDYASQIRVDGIDMVLVLDVSGSMQFQDYDDAQKSRLDIAKEEAIRFIQMRDNDAIGLVIFGQDAMSRCPITLDKIMLERIVNDLHIGIINPDGTMLVTAMVTAANRLKSSKAKSKIMIVLTDGEPSDGDMDAEVILQIARELGIKIYTVGIGSEQEQVFMHPFYGMVQKPKVNTALLTHFAKSSGGQFFMAHNAQDMRRIYATIDQLETTKHDIPLFSRATDFLQYLGPVALIFLISEILLSTVVWFIL